jgi:hypothetical protein
MTRAQLRIAKSESSSSAETVSILPCPIPDDLIQEVRDCLNRAASRSQNRIRVEPWLIRHNEGNGWIWACRRDGKTIGYCMTDLYACSTGKRIFRMLGLGAREGETFGLSFYHTTITRFEEFAQKAGCASVLVEGRSAWGRILAPEGYHEVFRTWEKEII